MEQVTAVSQRDRSERRGRLPEPIPSLVVIGQAPFSGELNASLMQRFGMLTHEPDADAAITAMHSGTVAIVLISGLAQRGDARRLEATCRAIRSERRLEFVHVLGVIPEGSPDSVARRLYRADIHAVVEWPTERENLTDFLVELLSVDPGHSRISSVDAGLARTARTKLRAIRERGDRVSVKVRNGVVYLSGGVASLRRRDGLEEEVSLIPGIRHVVVGNLRIAGQEGGDAKIARAARRCATLVGKPDQTSLSVSVRDGAVEISGFVTGGADRQRLAWMIRNLDGVRAVRNRARVAAGGSQKQRLISRQIAARVGDRFAGCQVEVRTFGRVVELRGTVRLLAERRAIETFSESIEGVERVVNKLVVRAPSTE